jgi:hypothetical protein
VQNCKKIRWCIPKDTPAATSVTSFRVGMLVLFYLNYLYLNDFIHLFFGGTPFAKQVDLTET